MIFVSVSFLSKHNMSIPASSSMDTNRKTLPKPDEALRSAHPQCEEEGLKCNPSSSGVLIVVEVIDNGLGGWRAYLPTPSDNIHAQPTFTWRCIKPFRAVVTLDMHIESLTDVPPMTTSDFRPISDKRNTKVLPVAKHDGTTQETSNTSVFLQKRARMD